MNREEVVRIFGEDGALAEKMPSFHPRPSQAQMAALVADAIAKGLVGIVEAGTGTGKSLAYLVPSLALLPEDARVIISTQTIHLQQQIMAKDLPLASKLLPEPPKAALLLGRNNYLCRRKLTGWQQDAPNLTPDERRFFMRVTDAVQNGCGNRQFLPFTADPQLWGEVASESETCLRGRCPWNNACFWQLARKEAFEARIVIVNHHLFFSDLALRSHLEWESERSLLPPYQYVVFDEAHHLENVATEYLGYHWVEEVFARRLDRLMRKDGRRRNGWLPGLRNRLLERARELSALQEQLTILEQQVIPGVLKLEAAVKSFARQIEKALVASAENEVEETTLRFKASLLELLPDLAPALEDLIGSLRAAESGISSLVDALENEAPGSEDAIFLAETGRGLAEFRFELPLLLDGGHREYVCWLERTRGGKVALHRVPLHIGPLFHEAFLSHVGGAVFTSATLTVDNQFSYFRERMGINNVHPSLRRELVLPPAFEYREQALVLSIRDLPEPDAPDIAQKLAEALVPILRASSGRAFVLFTNQQQMKNVYRQVEAVLTELGMTLFVQGGMTRHRLLQKFKSSNSPVLFGMDSFWEGVDIPGDQLSCVILTRLPFRVPTEPVQEARVEAMRREGLDAFRLFSLPQAVLRFKQGFGRLIRTREDRGVVVVLDSRMATKNYGRDFLNSLPGGTMRLVSQREVAAAIEDWRGRTSIKS